jgi:Na+-driven multidrug efflux pump
MYRNLTKGRIGSTLLFALPMIAGDLLQQMYNVADTLIVGRVLGTVLGGYRYRFPLCWYIMRSGFGLSAAGLTRSEKTGETRRSKKERRCSNLFMRIEENGIGVIFICTPQGRTDI